MKKINLDFFNATIIIVSSFLKDIVIDKKLILYKKKVNYRLFLNVWENIEKIAQFMAIH